MTPTTMLPANERVQAWTCPGCGENSMEYFRSSVSMNTFLRCRACRLVARISERHLFQYSEPMMAHFAWDVMRTHAKLRNEYPEVYELITSRYSDVGNGGPQ